MSSRHCQACGSRVSASAKFCRACGVELAAVLPEVAGALRCPSCDADTRPDAKFCRSCGAALTDRQPQSRRPAADTGARPAAAGGGHRRGLWIGAGVAAAVFAVAGVVGLVVFLVSQDDDEGATGPEGIAIFVSPFDDGETLFTAASPDGTRITVEGVRAPDAALTAERVSFLGDEFSSFQFGPDGLVSRAEAFSTTGESAALDLHYEADTVTMDFFESVDATVPTDSVTISLQHAPDIRELLDELAAAQSTLPESVGDGPWFAVNDPVGEAGVVPAFRLADGDVEARFQTEVTTESGQPVEALDVWWVLNTPLDFLDCFIIEEGVSLQPGGQQLLTRREANRCRDILSNRYQVGEFSQRSDRMTEEGNGLYSARVPISRPLTEREVEDLCSSAATTWLRTNTALGIVGLGVTVFGPDPISKSAGVATMMTALGLGTSYAPSDCVALGRAREEAFEEPWTAWSNILGGRDPGLVGDCIAGLDDAARSEDETFTAQQLVGGELTNIQLTIGLLDELKAEIVAGPAALDAGDTATYTARAAGGSGGYVFSWHPSPAGGADEAADQSVAAFAASQLQDAPLQVSVEDREGCSAADNLVVEVTGQQGEAVVAAEGSFQPPLDPGSSIGTNEIALRFSAEGGDVTGEWTLVVHMDLGTRGYDCTFTQTTSGPIQGTFDGARTLRGTTVTTASISGVSGCDDVDLEQGTGSLEWSASFDGQEVVGSIGSIPFMASGP